MSHDRTHPLARRIQYELLREMERQCAQSVDIMVAALEAPNPSAHLVVKHRVALAGLLEHYGRCRPPAGSSTPELVWLRSLEACTSIVCVAAVPSDVSDPWRVEATSARRSMGSRATMKDGQTLLFAAARRGSDGW